MVASRDNTTTLHFQVLQENTNMVGRDFLDLEAVDGLAGKSCRTWNKQAERVAITPLRVWGEVSLANEILQQKAADPRPKQSSVSVSLGDG